VTKAGTPRVRGTVGSGSRRLNRPATHRTQIEAVATSAKTPTRAGWLVATLRDEGFVGLVGTIGDGVAWRARRLQRSQHVRARRLLRAWGRVRTRRDSEMPTPGIDVCEPMITVIVTSRDRAELLGLALRSVQLQDFAEWECIVVDDASLDDAVQVAQTFAAVDKRFTVLSHDRVRGLSAARNSGLAVARAPYVCFLDDDDLLLSGSLRRRLEVLRAQPTDVAGVYCDWIGIEPDERLERLTSHRRPRRLPTVSFGDFASGARFISSSPLLAIGAVRAAGGFDEDLLRAEDVDLWLRIARAGYRFAYADTVGVGYRRSPGSLVIGAPDVQLDSLLRILRGADRPLPDDADVPPRADRRPLSAAAFELAYAPQILNCLALLADRDLQQAVEIGLRELTPQFRRTLEPSAVAATLTPSVTRRLGRTAAAEVADVRRRILVLLELLALPAPQTLPAAGGRLDTDEWSRRARRVAVTTVARHGVAAEFDGAVLLVAEAPYHVEELGLLHEVLAARGIKARFMSAARPLDATRWAIGRHVDVLLPFDLDLATSAAGVVVLNDWGYARPLVEACNHAGVPTFAKVEGVQDFDDVDTGRLRGAYRTAAIVLGQGQIDYESLPDCDVRIVGSSRLERIWRAAPAEPGDHVLVNLNFTYSVMADARGSWLATVEDAVRSVGIEAIVSRHPAERSRPSTLPMASKPFRYAINRAGVLVSRFSTVPFEAMARGVPFVYHNPHGERVGNFAEPCGAFLGSRSAAELAAALPTAMSWRAGYRDRVEKFFRRQVDIDDHRPSEVRAADVIVEAIARVGCRRVLA
jgi:glycosyl transferase family 2